jgi:FkbM family methyltransferase
MTLIEKKIRYYLEIIPISGIISNWLILFLVYFRLVKRATLKLKTGEKFIISHFLDALTIKEVFLDRDYQPQNISPKTIIDIGGNIGTTSVFYARRFPRSKILTLEPSAPTFNLMCKNFKLNNCSNVIPMRAAVSAHNGTIKLFSNPASGLSSLFDYRSGTHPEIVPAVNLSKIFSKYKIRQCDLMKLDCEGAEYDILFHCPKVILRQIKNLILEYHEGYTGYTGKDLTGFLTRQGYRVHVKPHPLETNIGLLYAVR